MNKNLIKRIGVLATVLAISILAALLTGCPYEYDPSEHRMKDLPRDGTPIYFSVDPNVTVSPVHFEVGARIWDSVGVNFQRSDTPQVRFNIDQTSDNSRFLAITSVGQSETRIYVNVRVTPSADWHAVAHEFGHALGLGHVDNGVCNIMSPAICNREATLSDGDLVEFEASGERNELN